jgi:hypothetical protein
MSVQTYACKIFRGIEHNEELLYKIFKKDTALFKTIYGIRSGVSLAHNGRIIGPWRVLLNRYTARIK